tara:strand:- start:423 stop:851 length:429 start_codon:yes stop_codon:yes gene_type:complete
LKILSVELDDFFPQGVTEFKEFHRFPPEFLNIILVPSNPPLQVSHIGLIVLDVLIDVGFPIRIILFPIHEFLADFPLLTLVRRRLRGDFFRSGVSIFFSRRSRRFEIWSSFFKISFSSDIESLVEVQKALQHNQQRLLTQAG